MKNKKLHARIKNEFGSVRRFAKVVHAKPIRVWLVILQQTPISCNELELWSRHLKLSDYEEIRTTFNNFQLRK